VGSELGLTTEKLLAIPDYATSPHFDDRERIAFSYADAMTLRCTVDDELFARLQEHYTDDAIVELTEVIAWENASARFNRALGIPSQGLWKRS
jgi:alkylhydroperoxidase family enzyme